MPFSTALHVSTKPHEKLTPLPKVSRIKERVEEKEGIPPVQQRLIFGGKQMYEISPPSRLVVTGSRGALLMGVVMGFRADDKMASEYNLEGGATLHLVLALRGGL